MTYTTDKGDTHLLGDIDIDDLKQEPYNEWFDKEIEQDYTLENIDLLKETKVKIYLGTWCGDSKKWVPEFFKLWHDNKLPIENIEIVALHNETDVYKQSPEKTEKAYNIHRVPTFIFLKEDEEVGRMVDSPINDMKTDLAQIAMGLPSKPRYRAVPILNDAMNESLVDSLLLKKNYQPLLREVYREISKSSELNTYGYVLKAQGELRKAELAFYLNRNIYRWDPNTWDSLGEIYFDQERYEDAKVTYEKVLELDPENENAKEMLEKIAKETLAER